MATVAVGVGVVDCGSASVTNGGGRFFFLQHAGRKECKPGEVRRKRSTRNASSKFLIRRRGRRPLSCLICFICTTGRCWTRIRGANPHPSGKLSFFVSPPPCPSMCSAQYARVTQPQPHSSSPAPQQLAHAPQTIPIGRTTTVATDQITALKTPRMHALGATHASGPVERRGGEGRGGGRFGRFMTARPVRRPHGAPAAAASTATHRVRAEVPSSTGTRRDSSSRFFLCQNFGLAPGSRERSASAMGAGGRGVGKVDMKGCW